VPPLAALREAAIERRRPGVVQWIVGLSCLAGVVAAQVLAPQLDPVFALVMAILAPELVVIGVMCFGDAIFPALAGVLARPFVGRDVAARLARDQVRASSRTTASLAAPVVAISAIGGSLLVVLSFTADWSAALDREQLEAPLVVQVDQPAAASTVLESLARNSDVAVADVRRTANLTLLQAGERDVEQADVVDLPSAIAARGLRATRGNLDELHGRSVAVTRSWLSDSGSALGRSLRVRLHGRTVSLRIVAVVREAPDLYGDLIVDRSLLGVRTSAPSTVFVVPRTTTSATAASLRDGLRGTGARVMGASHWVDEVEQKTRSSNTMVLWVMLGPAGAYAAIAVVNTVLIGIGQRRRQHRVVRLLGATGRQVRRTALWEAALAGCAGLVVGAAVVGWVGQLVGRAIVTDVPGTSLTLPWTPLAGIAGTCIGLVLVAAAIGARRTGRA
jgi:putative ABC transport system permease protein